jgi:prefoldin subunit 5
MANVANAADSVPEDRVAAELSRLERQIRALNRQLDRIEEEMWRALNELAREGFEQ